MIFNNVSALAIISWIIYSTGVVGVLSVNSLAALMRPKFTAFRLTEPVYHIVYYAFIIISFNLVAFIPSLASYRLLVIAFLTVGFQYLTADMILCIPLVVSVNHGFIPISYLNRYFGDSTAFSSELNAALGGTIMLIMAWIGMIVSLSRSAST